MNVDGLRRAIQESCTEAIILWKNDLDYYTEIAATTTTLDLCGIQLIYAEDVLSASGRIEPRNRSNGDSQISATCSHLSKACWISMSCGENTENDDEPIGYITEARSFFWTTY